MGLFNVYFNTAGIGVDDMFVMLAAWRQTDFRLSVEERMGKAFSEAALSITITSLTDVLSIGIGAITKFRSVRIFSAYTATALLFDYLYQITFFAACMVITGHREKSNRHSVACMKTVPKSLAGRCINYYVTEVNISCGYHNIQITKWKPQCSGLNNEFVAIVVRHLLHIIDPPVI